jgi:hypothetical protein
MSDSIGAASSTSATSGFGLAVQYTQISLLNFTVPILRVQALTILLRKSNSMFPQIDFSLDHLSFLTMIRSTPEQLD